MLAGTVICSWDADSHLMYTFAWSAIKTLPASSGSGALAPPMETWADSEVVAPQPLKNTTAFNLPSGEIACRAGVFSHGLRSGEAHPSRIVVRSTEAARTNISFINSSFDNRM